MRHQATEEGERFLCELRECFRRAKGSYVDELVTAFAIVFSELITQQGIPDDITNSLRTLLDNRIGASIARLKSRRH